MRSWPAPEVPRLDAAGLGTGRLPQVHDTASGGLVALGGASEDIRIYVCGITPYDATHLGHAATYLLFDLIQRLCLDAGRPVRYVQNVTDVDDPLLERAGETGQDWAALAEQEIELFRTDMAALRILPPEQYVGAVEAIPVIVEVIEELRERGAAYELDGDVYFSAAATDHLGAVGHYSVEEMIRLSGERGGDPQRPGKKDPLDCLLWQAARPGEPAWESPLGPGRPGWHVECAAIALRHLGPVIDVQGGGSDLVFPHHELGAAEAAVVTGQWPVARTFVHQAMVGYQGEKMSKSRGNLVFVSRLRAAGVDPMAIRLALLAHDHRHDWEWHDAELEAAGARLARWRQAFDRAAAAPAQPLVEELRGVLGDGLRTPDALALVDRWAAKSGEDAVAPGQVRLAVDALLGIV
ncbi:MAG TPA: cysteine--1-D-myo-inosityl 2-amino-2-deoxy-alpha-D-glucopyranoside ligase [Mycobacteriales bacterium]|nr:cysteine--1-D-myo-inosityl 2-amino-2-deoxy-alpha-D-glucopyranoside ligase [Mycobacteriales bacterium]